MCTAYLDIKRHDIDNVSRGELARQINSNPDNPKVRFLMATMNPTIVRLVFHSKEKRTLAVERGLKLDGILVHVSLPRGTASDDTKQRNKLRMDGVPLRVTMKELADFLVDNGVTPLNGYYTAYKERDDAYDGGRMFNVEYDKGVELPGYVYMTLRNGSRKRIKLWYPGMNTWCSRCIQKGHIGSKCPNEYSGAVISSTSSNLWGKRQIPPESQGTTNDSRLHTLALHEPTPGEQDALLNDTDVFLSPPETVSNGLPDSAATASGSTSTEPLAVSHGSKDSTTTIPTFLKELEEKGNTPYDLYLAEMQAPKSILNKRTDVVPFWSRHAQNKEFSNFTAAEFRLDRQKYDCVEQFYYKWMAEMDGNSDLANTIMTLQKGLDIKRAGSPSLSIKGTNDPRLRHAFNILWVANFAKYTSDTSLLEKLFSTVGKRLVEVGTKPTVWCTGLKDNERLRASWADRSKYPMGCRNIFGDLLTLLRTHLMALPLYQSIANKAFLARTDEQLSVPTTSTGTKRQLMSNVVAGPDKRIKETDEVVESDDEMSGDSNE